MREGFMIIFMTLERRGSLAVNVFLLLSLLPGRSCKEFALFLEEAENDQNRKCCCAR